MRYMWICTKGAEKMTTNKSQVDKLVRLLELTRKDMDEQITLDDDEIKEMNALEAFLKEYLS